MSLTLQWRVFALRRLTNPVFVSERARSCLFRWKIFAHDRWLWKGILLELFRLLDALDLELATLDLVVTFMLVNFNGSINFIVRVFSHLSLRWLSWTDKVWGLQFIGYVPSIKYLILVKWLYSIRFRLGRLNLLLLFNTLKLISLPNHYIGDHISLGQEIRWGYKLTLLSRCHLNPCVLQRTL